MVFGCGVIADTLPYGFALLEESLAFIGGTYDQRDMAPNNALVCHAKVPLPNGTIPLSYSVRCENIVLSLIPRTPVIPDASSTLAHSILWRPPDARITLVELFGGIGTILTAVLEAGLTVKRYVYVDNSQVSTCVIRHHLYELMVLYPQLLPLTAGVFHVSFVMSHTSVRLTDDTWVRWIWSLRDGHARAIHALEPADV